MTTILTTDIVSLNQFGAYVFTSDTNIVSDAGSHLFYIGGSFDTLTSVGSYEMVLANGGNNTINLSGGTGDTVFMSGGNNVVNAGAGTSSIVDAGGTGDTIVVPGAASGFDSIMLLAGADAKLDFTTALKGTDWNGSTATLANYISSTTTAGVTTIALSATSHGAATAVASVSVPGGTPWDMPTVLAHVVS